MTNDKKNTSKNDDEELKKEKEIDEKANESEEKSDEEEEEKKRLESFRKAGEIHKKVIEFIKPKVVVGAKFLDICDQVEEKIIELEGEIGFPTNICINNIACHYTSPPEDDSEIIEGDVVKIDIGVSVEGFVADGAFTVSFNKDPITENLITAVETAVLKGMSEIKAGVNLNKIGEVTSKIIKGFGYRPIKDLSGHLIEEYNVHGRKNIPNVKLPTKGKAEFEEGEVYALECFASTGKGNIHASKHCYIYGFNMASARVPIRRKITRQVIGWLGKNRKTLPFSTRQLHKEFKTYKFALQELKNSDKVIEHYVLKEDQDDAYIAQFEHTFLVTKDGIEQLT